MLQQLNSNPYFQQAEKMAKGKSEKEIMEIAKNICREKGINIDEEFEIGNNNLKDLVVYVKLHKIK